jgi:hypothetical protein
MHIAANTHNSKLNDSPVVTNDEQPSGASGNRAFVTGFDPGVPTHYNAATANLQNDTMLMASFLENATKDKGTRANAIDQQSVTITAPYSAHRVNQVTISHFETFTPHPTDPTKIIGRIRLEIPHAPGTYYEQMDELPMLDEDAVSPSDPSFYFIVDLTAAKVPQRRRANKENNYKPDLWIRQPGTREIWTRPGLNDEPVEVWEFIGVFRRFNATTHKYEQIHINLAKLKNVDPNDKTWQYAYNKWIDQIRRRRDGTYIKEVSKDHWTHAERRALYDAINEFVRKAGLHAFGFGQNVAMSNIDIQSMTDAVNRVGGKNRLVDAVRGQISSSHPRKNKAIYDLMGRGINMRERLKHGEIVSRSERHPQNAILLSLFPPDENTTSGNSKRGRNHKGSIKSLIDLVSDAESGSLESRSSLHSLSQPSSSCVASPDPITALRMKEPGLPPNNRSTRIEDSDGNEIAESDTWVDEEADILEGEFEDEHAEVMSWETCSESSLEGKERFRQQEEDLARKEAAVQAKQEALAIQMAALNSLRDQPLPPPPSCGIALSGRSSSGSDSDSDVIPAVAPISKRKRMADDLEDTGSLEAEKGSLQAHPIKKTRT